MQVKTRPCMSAHRKPRRGAARGQEEEVDAARPAGSPAPGGPPLPRPGREEEEEEEEEEEGGEACSQRVSVAMLGGEAHPCQLSPAPLQRARVSLLLSWLLVMALTLWWIVFI
ncbi:coiled-coil domain-containing protein 96-like [Anguilla anguilla]|uniref:coiled-coil domain-containing protein 96-like n=1 Tax=Anguilla anguilla TaxID=7936 RepID=UPI0015A8BF89|nr:coiled-coil domain-containing protein 96-like [Anguilla anguilla]